MEIINHDGRPDIKEVLLETDPLVIFLDSRRELRIERGDSLEEIAREVYDQNAEGWGLSWGETQRLVAYWFSLGERLRDTRWVEGWDEEELEIRDDRRYLEEST